MKVFNKEYFPKNQPEARANSQSLATIFLNSIFWILPSLVVQQIPTT
jgi:hypothetical protein